ncbi:hypothetical protein EVAR_51321_1 [Eumeta japonica]|uniref:Uncharacterized protein n=1 Tax=Eumeta variegata TaxID=151549 RepID=A0A4C2A1W4_EUMVA|nr:hypothetical protein EVAR_51321_1 [Eumeta japonica]
MLQNLENEEDYEVINTVQIEQLHDWMEVAAGPQNINQEDDLARALTTSKLEELLEIIDEGYRPCQPLPAQPTIEDYVHHKLQSSGRVCNRTLSYPQE